MRNKILITPQEMKDVLANPHGHDVVWPTAADKALALSFTKIETFETCPRQYAEKYIWKTVPYKETPTTRWGNQVHKAMEDYVLNGKPITDKSIKPFASVGDALIAKENNLHDRGILVRPLFGEQEWACDLTMREHSWFDNNGVFLRGKADCGMGTQNTLFLYDYKGLALDTPIATPQGFTTMGDIQEGDELYDHTGRVCKVIGKSKVKHLRCFKLTFDTGESIVCDEEHLWLTTSGRVRNVQDFLTLKYDRSVPVPGEIQGGWHTMPVAPYTLGLWLADGRNRGGEICKPYPEVWDRVRLEGYSVGDDISGAGRSGTRTVYGLTGKLRDLSLLHNKHIPAVYLRGSVPVRRALLSGLMDGDGTVNITRNELVYCTTDKHLAEDVAALVRTLGRKARIHPVAAKGFGLERTAYWVKFRAMDWPVFSIAHKAEAEAKVRAHVKNRAAAIGIVSVEEVESVPTQCILVDSEHHTFLCGHTYIPTHNTGKGSNPKPEQLELMGLMAMAQSNLVPPTVKKIDGTLLYLEARKTVPFSMPTVEYKERWVKWVKRAFVILDAYQRDSFPEKQSGLCRKWCDCFDCPFNGRNADGTDK